jgi:hypothetical protein
MSKRCLHGKKEILICRRIAAQQVVEAPHFLSMSFEKYFPEQIHVEAQNGDGAKETATRAIWNGDQSKSHKDAAAPHGVCRPRGKKLRQLL